MPLSAELKMIQQLQKLVAKQTKDYDGRVTPEQREGDEGKAMAKQISVKQGRVEDLTRKLANQLNKNEEAREAGERK
ncbi:MAG: hypothetical protein R3F56_22970 [Planctomycetota bacterium]